MKIVKLAGTAVAIGLVGLASLTLGPSETHAGPAGAPVVVTNTADQKVPIAGTVSVGNDKTLPLYVYGIEKREPFSVTKGAQAGALDILDVPADRRAVVESISCSIGVPTEVATVSVQVSARKLVYDSYYREERPVQVGFAEFLLQQHYWRFTGTHQIQLHAQPRESISVGFGAVDYNGGFYEGSWRSCTVSGYLVAV